MIDLSSRGMGPMSHLYVLNNVNSNVSSDGQHPVPRQEPTSGQAGSSCVAPADRYNTEAYVHALLGCLYKGFAI